MSEYDQTFLSHKIIEHLMSKENMQDDISGLVLDIYEKEMKQLSEKIIKHLSELKEKGIITEYKDGKGKQYYKLLKPIGQ